MYRFLIVIEKANDNYSAYLPDLTGCATTGAIRGEAEKNMHEAIELHMHGLEYGMPISESNSFAECTAIP